MYEHIIEPLTNRKTDIKSKKGKKILLNYLYNINKPSIQESFSAKGGSDSSSSQVDWLHGTNKSSYYSNLLLDYAYIISFSNSPHPKHAELKTSAAKLKTMGPVSGHGQTIPIEFVSTDSTKNNNLIDPDFFKKHLIDDLNSKHLIHANYYMFDRDIAHDFKNKKKDNIFGDFKFPKEDFLSDFFKINIDKLIDRTRITDIDCERHQNYVYVSGLPNKLHFVKKGVRAYIGSSSTPSGEEGADNSDKKKKEKKYQSNRTG